MIEVAFEFTEGDALRLARLARLADDLSVARGRAARLDWSIRWYEGFLTALWIVPVAIVGLGAVCDVFATGRDLLVAIGASTAWMVALFVKGILDRRAFRGVGDGVIAANRRYGFFGPVCVRIDETGVRGVGPGYVVETDWAKVHLVDRREGFVFLTLALGWVVTVPRRAFASDEEFERFDRPVRERRRAAVPR